MNLADHTSSVNIFAKDNHFSRGRIFDRDFVFASLAFLSSRILSTSKNARAAVVIQRCYRRKLRRSILRRRVAAARIARECVMVVKARERLLWAKETILRVWREHKRRKSQSSMVVPRKQEVRIENDLDDEDDIWLAL